MKVLITGGTGTISSGIAEACVCKGYDTYTINRGNHKERNIEGVKYYYANIYDVEEVRRILRNEEFDVIIECLVFNIEQLKISLENFAHRCKQYIFISTTSVYSGGKTYISETDNKTGTEWRYSKNKIECEAFLAKYFVDKSSYYTIVRPSVTYGNYRVPFPVSTRKPVYTFFKRIRDGKPLVSCDNVLFSVTHIIDFSRAVVALLGNNKAVNEDFNIATSDSSTYWDEVAKLAGDFVQGDCIVIHIPLSCFLTIWPEQYDELYYNKSKSKIIDCSKLESVIGQFEATVSLRNGLEMLYESSKENFYSQGLEVDGYWDRMCDLVLYYAYKFKKLDLQSYILADNYFKNDGVNTTKLKFGMYKQILKVFLKKCLSKFF